MRVSMSFFLGRQTENEVVGFVLVRTKQRAELPVADGEKASAGLPAVVRLLDLVGTNAVAPWPPWVGRRY